MYTVEVGVEGIAPLMQHRYPLPDYADINKGGKKVTGSVDYSDEWKGYLYASSGYVCQPASHFERAMVSAAGGFRITGKRGKSYRDLVQAGVYVSPDMISHGIPVPTELSFDADRQMYLDIRPVVIQRARVARVRPVIHTGWKLSFEIEVIDDQLPANILREVLDLAGKTCGVGDYRPRFGRFMVTRWEVSK